MSKELKIKPYARLITMLGDQLIKNELIALTELIKNSYDADASWVKIDFVNFNEDFSINEESKLIIEDNGNGMTEEIIEKHWLNPATPEKLQRKETRNKTQKGRVLQGEKGIGRFAIFKLGKKIKITTRRQKLDNNKFVKQGLDSEYIVTYDFSKYDSDFLYENGQNKELYLEDLSVSLEVQQPKVIINKKMSLGTTSITRDDYGTIIEISDLKTNWTKAKLERLQLDIGKMQPIFYENNKADFYVWILKDGKIVDQQRDYHENLNKLLDTKSVFKVTNGQYNESDENISFDLNNKFILLDLNDPEIKGLRQYKEYFNENSLPTNCGNFKFEFYIFDFSAKSDTKYVLDKQDKEILKEHRIYLYRDNIRVMPYGDTNDDWLKIDISRGTISAGQYLSNDQVVGCINITQEGNPDLKDKTNREGLIETGRALDDFITILQIILRYLRIKPYKKYLIDKEKKKKIDAFKEGNPSDLLDKIKQATSSNKNAQKLINEFEKGYNIENTILNDRIRKTENLAAVGLSVEAASHDIMLFLGKTISTLDLLLTELTFGAEIDREALVNQLTILRGNLGVTETQLKDIQLLFPSTKSKTKLINVKNIIDTIHRLYKTALKKNEINVEILPTNNPLIVKTTDATLMQVFINLFDNALYWLTTIDGERKIIITINGDENRVIFSDNGPGIKEDDINYIFEAFYSGKGEEGRGLGLYIARQLLDRYDYTIDLAEFSKDEKLNGANFVLEFVKE